MNNLRTRSDLLQNLYDRLFLSGYTLSKCKDAIIAERLYPGPTDSINVVGRSIAWKLFLAREEPLQESLPPRPSVLIDAARLSRKVYAELLEEKCQGPDAKHRPKVSSNRQTQSSRDLDLVNPLSLHNENPWNEWFAGVELRKVISQDVERTFPEIDFFRQSTVQNELTNILFLYSSLNPSIGYRQGMHELLAPLYFAVSFDSLKDGEVQNEHYQELVELCSANFVAADAWALFNSVMKGVSKWYEWRDPKDTQISQRNSLAFQSLVIIPNGQNGLLPYIAPIVQACNHIQLNMLKACDPVLWQHLQKAGIEPQIYGIRWLRLLFTREFSMADALKLWDGLFACDSTLDLAQWICVAMLIRIRNEIIPADYSGQLTTLLRYPSPTSSDIEGAPHHTLLLLRQALALQLSPNPATGDSVIMENRNFLGIPIQVPLTPLSSTIERNRNTRLGSSTPPPHSQGDGTVGKHSSKQSSSSPISISEIITRGFVERGESLGINKTLMSAVSEIRRNIPEFAASLGVRPSSQQLASYPLIDERPIEERPPWEPRTRFEMERDISEIRSRDKSLGESLAWIVDALLLDESEARDLQWIKKQKREALESLSYVRDVLMSNISTLDDDRLIGGEERSRREKKALKKSEDLHAATKAAIVSPPIPVPVADSIGKRSGNHRVRTPFPDSIPPLPNLLKNTTDTVRRAPWNYTPSSFSDPSALPTALLPRPPPPTSTTLRHESKKSRDDAVHDGSGYSNDPLGALR